MSMPESKRRGRIAIRVVALALTAYLCVSAYLRCLGLCPELYLTTTALAAFMFGALLPGSRKL